MGEGKKYDVFKHKDRDILEIYPELTYLASGVIAKDISIDEVIRYVVFFYDMKNDIHSKHTDVLEARKEALQICGIGKRFWDNKDFMEVEAEVSSRYMIHNRETEFSLYISMSFQFASINRQLRLITSDNTWQENINSLKSSNELIAQAEVLSGLKKRLFGDFEHIEKYITQKAVEDRYKIEEWMA